MCSAIKEMREESEIIGSIKAYKELEKTQEETAEYIVRKYKLSQEKATEYLKEYW